MCASPPRVARLRSHHSIRGRSDVQAAPCRRRRRPRFFDAAGGPTLRRPLVRHHSLRRLHEVRQPRLRTARYRLPQLGGGSLRSGGHTRAGQAHRPGRQHRVLQPALEVGAPLIGGVPVGRGSVLLYDAALRLRVPVAGGLPISPFVQGGAGAVRRSFDIGPASTHATNFAYNVGARAPTSRLHRGSGCS